MHSPGSYFQSARDFRLFVVLRANRGALIRGTICLLVVDTIVFLLPYLVKLMVDRLQGVDMPEWLPQSFHQLTTAWFLALLCAVYILGAVLIAWGRYWWRVFLIWSTFPWFHRMREALFKHIQNLNRDFFKSAKVGDLLSALTTDTENMRMTAGIGSLMVIDATINFIFFPILLYMLNPTLMWMIVPPLLIISFGAIILTQRLSKYYETVQDLTASLSGRAFELVAGVRVIKAFRKERPIHGEFIHESKKLRDASLQVARYQSLFVPGLDFVLSIALCWSLLYGGWQVMEGHMPLSNLIAFQLYLNHMDWPMMAIGWFIQMYRQSEASERRVVGFAEQTNPLQAAPWSGVRRHNQLTFELESVTYAHPNQPRPQFKNLICQVTPRTWLGVTGPVGSGKSTLLELLSRQRDPQSGVIYFEGRPLSSIVPAEVRTQILYMPQESFAFSRSIRENIALGLDVKPPDNKLWELLEDLSFDREALLERGGLGTTLGERGVNLSGGQKQRLSLGRGLVRQRKVYLLDDLFSHVDTETEGKLVAALKKYIPPDATVVLVSQRLETLRRCDELLVLNEQGELEFKGLPAEGMAKSKFLKSLEELQHVELSSVERLA